MRGSGESAARHSRRRVLEFGVAATLVASGVAVAAVRSRGYRLPEGRALVNLRPWQFSVVQHAARRIAAPDDPADTTIPSPDAVDVAGFADLWLSDKPASMRRDLGRFLAYLEHVAPLGVGSLSRFTRLAPEDQDRVLQALESSYSGPLRAGFAALKGLVFMGYYRDPRTWRVVGYDGPLVARPPRGWW